MARCQDMAPSASAFGGFIDDASAGAPSAPPPPRSRGEKKKAAAPGRPPAASGYSSEEAPKAKESPSRNLADSLTRAFRRDGARGQPPSPTGAAPSPLAGRRTLAVIQLTNLRDGALFAEATVLGAPLAWAPGATVWLLLDDGTEVEAEVHLGRTTAPGTLAAGLTLRLVFSLSAPLPPGRVVAAVLVGQDLALVVTPTP